MKHSTCGRVATPPPRKPVKQYPPQAVNKATLASDGPGPASNDNDVKDNNNNSSISDDNDVKVSNSSVGDDRKPQTTPEPLPSAGIPDIHLIFYPNSNWTVRIHFEGETCIIFRQWIELASPVFKEFLKDKPADRNIDVNFEQDLKPEMLSKQGRGYSRHVLPMFFHFCHILVTNRNNIELATFLPALPARGQAGFLAQSLQLCRLAEDLGCATLQKVLTTLIVGTIDSSADGIVFDSHTERQVESNTKRARSLIQALGIIRAGSVCAAISEWEDNVVRVLSNVVFHAYDHGDGTWGLWWERLADQLPNSILCQLMKGALRGIAEQKRDKIGRKVRGGAGFRKGSKRHAPIDLTTRASGPLKRIKKELVPDGSAFAPLTIDDD